MNEMACCCLSLGLGSCMARALVSYRPQRASMHVQRTAVVCLFWLSLTRRRASRSHMCVQEASLLRRLRHRNIVGFRGVAIMGGKGMLLMVSLAPLTTPPHPPQHTPPNAPPPPQLTHTPHHHPPTHAPPPPPLSPGQHA